MENKGKKLESPVSYIRLLSGRKLYIQTANPVEIELAITDIKEQLAKITKK